MTKTTPLHQNRLCVMRWLNVACLTLLRNYLLLCLLLALQVYLEDTYSGTCTQAHTHLLAFVPSFFFFFNNFCLFVCLFVLIIYFYLFIYIWLCWVFFSVRGLSPVAASGGHSSSWCTGLPLSRPLLLRSTGSRRAGPVIVAHGPSCSAARGILPDQGSNPCPLHWQADSQPLRHQGSPVPSFNNGSGQTR